MQGDYVLSIDQGTTRTKAVVFGGRARVKGIGYSPVLRVYPQPGWVEQSPAAIWRSVLEASRKALRVAGVSAREIAAVGIADQGETVVMWDRRNARPVYNAIVWQCRRTAKQCEALKAEGLEPTVRRKTGLLIDPYFSATKIRWIIDNVPQAKQLLKSGDLTFGTTDTWLIWNMTKGHRHVTDYSTASRTMLLNIRRLEWDEELLEMFRVPSEVMPELCPNAGVVAHTDPQAFLGIDAPVSGVIVDQQGALFGHGCVREGDLKNTYGTGCFMLMNIGDRPRLSKNKLLTTVAWVLAGRATYALDGGVYVAGSAIDWLGRGLGIVRGPKETSQLAKSVDSNEGIYFVPAFVGLAAPYWDSYARGTIVGITDGTRRAHLVRATLESIAFQVNEVLRCMRADTGLNVRKLRVDGGPTANEFLMQFQADISGLPVEVPEVSEVTALGAAYLAGMGSGIWGGTEEMSKSTKSRIYLPKMPEGTRKRLINDWNRAVARSRNWARETS